MHQRANDLLRIMHIHLAAKGFQIKRLFLLCAHSSSISQQNGFFFKSRAQRGISTRLNGNVGQQRTHSNIYKEIEGRVL
jgi:hypothetical protein